jgi:hypothetical protein
MHFHVTGTNHATGARMALDLAASNRADAERKAKAAGMDVQHVRQVTDGPEALHVGSRHRGEDHGAITGVHPIVKTLLILGIVTAAAWIAWYYWRATT